MAIESNSSEESVVKGGVQLYTGITPMKVIAVNPTLAKLHEMGIMLQSEPNYLDVFKDGKANKIVFWLENEDTKIPLEIIITPGAWTSEKTGKVKWLNAENQNLWDTEVNGKPSGAAFKEWHKDKDSFYICPRGIDTLTDFVQAWANVASGKQCKLDTVAAITKGDMSEIRQLVSHLANNQVRVLVYVRDGKYQATYDQHFGRLTPERNDLFVKAIGKEYGEPKGDYSFEWKAYVPAPAVPDAHSAAVGAGQAWLTDDDTETDPFK